jgi:hypothetical protein
LVRQADGKIVALGNFDDSGGELKRFHADGATDGGFGSAVKDAAFGPLALTRDGLVLVAPNTGNNLARLKVDGAVDDTFTVVVNDDIKLTAVDSKGRIVMAGYFTEVRGSFDDAGHAVARVRIARLTGGSVGGGGTVVPTPVSLGNVAVTPGWCTWVECADAGWSDVCAGEADCVGKRSVGGGADGDRGWVGEGVGGSDRGAERVLPDPHSAMSHATGWR